MLRPAEDRDRDPVLMWRNHPDVRAASLTQHVITPQEHAAWWDAATKDSGHRVVLVYDRETIACGTVNFFDISPDDVTPRSASWGFFLDVDGLTARGELLPAWVQVMREATRYAFEELRLDVLHGEVLESNEAVRSLNRRFGIEEVGTEQRLLDGVPTTVVTLVLRAERVRRGSTTETAGRRA